MMEPEFSCRNSDPRSRVLYATPGFLLFILALYFTLKAVVANFKTLFWLIIKFYF